MSKSNKKAPAPKEAVVEVKDPVVAPKAEAPKVEEPKVEPTPKVEAPKAEPKPAEKVEPAVEKKAEQKVDPVAINPPRKAGRGFNASNR